MTPEEFQKRIAKMSRDLKKAVNKDIPRKVAKAAVRAFKDNFRNEGFFGEKWEEVQRRKTKTVKYKTKTGKVKTKTVKIGKGAAGRRKILTGSTADLGKSIKSKVEGTTITVYSDLPYSAAHNEGTNNAGRGHKTKIPKRQFIGDHPELQKIIQNEIEQNLNDIFK
jgi:Phage virion morphogenesis family.